MSLLRGGTGHGGNPSFRLLTVPLCWLWKSSRKTALAAGFSEAKISRNCRNFAALQKDCSEFESPRLRGAATVTEGDGVAYLMTDHVARSRPFLKDRYSLSPVL